ncbi:hypothetical protein [Dyella choica]|uniref:Uncharacterized protein n=1 Tax=Dyella choica TaxID=1927959 RepID=A0A3S0Q4Q2_9GAMM|nr:hypothetical protein [Dyella choica]RUL75415.1 hypothetical protein EKH80_11905 [Dyella choica]
MERISRAIILFTLLSYAVAGYASDSVTCPDALRDAVADHFHLANFSADKDPRIIGESCKIWPHDTNLILSVFAYDEGQGQGGNAPDQWVNILVSVYDSRQGKLVNAYNYAIGEDATTKVGPESLTLDTASYPLAKNVYAFGVRFDNAAHMTSAADPDLILENHLTLFIRQGNTLRPVLKQFMYYQSFSRDEKNRRAIVSVDKERAIIRILPSQTNGLHDLLLAFKPEAAGADKDEATTPSHGEALKYNGARYANARKDALSSGWQREDEGF